MDNYNYFKSNLAELLGRYSNQYIVLKNESVIGYYDSFDEAYERTIKTEALGTFLIQHCIREEEDVVTFVSSNAIFA